MMYILARSKWIDRAALALALAIVATAYFYNLGFPPLWGDEAGTGLFARNVLQFGYPIAFDGRNLSIYDGGAELNANLAVVKIPWVQFYLGALSLHLFGDDAQGLRTIFALLGMVALFPLRAVLLSRVPLPLFVSTLILIAPQVALFHRNARYYSVLTVLFATLAWIVCSAGLTKRQRLMFSSVCMVLMFHTHPVAAAASGLALLLLAVWRRADFFSYLVACAIGVASWVLWVGLMGPPLIAPLLFPSFHGHPPSDWLAIFTRNLGASLSDMDAVQGLPILAWLFSLGALVVVRTSRFTEFAKDPLVLFVTFTLTVHLVSVAVLFGTETGERHALLRYMPHLIVFCLVPLFALIAKLVEDVRLYAVICGAILMTNFLSLSFWSNRGDKQIPSSWWPATYREILHPAPEALDAVMIEIGRDQTLVQGGTDTLVVMPGWLQEVAIFYLGQKLIVRPDIDAGSDAENKVRSRIGEKALAQFQKAPKWVLYGWPVTPNEIPGYEQILIPMHRLRPDDGTRPELTRHTFYQAHPVGNISLYRRRE